MTKVERSSTERRVQRRGYLFAAGAVLFALAVWGHWSYWYQPRVRAAEVSDSALLSQVPVRQWMLWLPFPHQNLAALKRSLDDPDRVVAAASRLAGLPAFRWPDLPPVGVPPASELVVASDAGGRGLWAGLRPYPVVAFLGRLAGWLADNPWLKGGRVAVAGRPAQVTWRGGSWELQATTKPRAPLASMSETPGSLLAQLQLASPVGSLPAGAYRLTREGRDLVVQLAGGAPPTSARLPSADNLVLTLVRVGRGGPTLFLLFSRQGAVGSLPAVAAFGSSDVERLVPAGSLLEALGRLPEAQLAGGTLVATDRDTLQAARAISDQWLPLLDAQDGPRLAMRVALAPATDLSRQMVAALQDLRFVAPSEVQRWQDLATLFAAARSYGHLTAQVDHDGSLGTLRLSVD